MKKVVVWDFPLRLFHWALVLLVPAAVVTAKVGGNAMEWHMRLGILLLGLLVFRLLWGVVGGQHARFRSFLRGPSQVLAYVRGRARPTLGHNPLGAWAVVAILAVLIAQVVTGLFANDDIMVEGPLYALVGKDFSDTLTGWHLKLQYVVYGVLGLHLLAVLFYRVVRRQDLVTPMLTGRKTVPADATEPVTRRNGHWLLGSALLGLSVLATWVAVACAG